jgi:hypothetical protein
MYRSQGIVSQPMGDIRKRHIDEENSQNTLLKYSKLTLDQSIC